MVLLSILLFPGIVFTGNLPVDICWWYLWAAESKHIAGLYYCCIVFLNKSELYVVLEEITKSVLTCSQRPVPTPGLFCTALQLEGSFCPLWWRVQLSCCFVGNQQLSASTREAHRLQQQLHTHTFTKTKWTIGHKWTIFHKEERACYASPWKAFVYHRNKNSDMISK